ncbi:MAG TPA: hypothetical protein VD905_22210, partial [Flavobacteriales bacterium]|nr:hypothetical protein [Flavobacteriales bacterium]
NGKNTSIHHTVFRNCTDDAIELETWGSENFRFYNNVITNCWGGISVGSNPRGPLYIYRNQVDATTIFKTEKGEKAGYCIKFGSDFANATENIKFYHNNFRGEEIIHVWDKKSNPDKFNNIEFINNVFYAEGNSDGISNLWSLVPCRNGNFFNGNLYNKSACLEKIKQYCPEFEKKGIVAGVLLSKGVLQIKKRKGVNQGTNDVLLNRWPDLVKIKDGKPDIGAREY